MTDETEHQPEANPLNRHFWMREFFPKADYSLASLGEKLSGIDALARLLANNTSLAIDARDNPESTDVLPINENLVGGLFSALTALTGAAFGSVCDMVERDHKAKEGAA